MSIELQGLDRVIAKLESLEDADGMKRAVQEACTLVSNAAIKKAPKDSGALRRSIQSKVESGNNEIVGTVFTDCEYAPFVCFGTGLFTEKSGRSTPWAYEDDNGNWHTTKGQHPQPFMRPALQENRKKITQILEEGMK